MKLSGLLQCSLHIFLAIRNSQFMCVVEVNNAYPPPLSLGDLSIMCNVIITVIIYSNTCTVLLISVTALLLKVP